MTDSKFEQLLGIQEKFPPLHPLNYPGADEMYPALSEIIAALMPIFLRRYPQRMKKVVEETAVVPLDTDAENESWEDTFVAPLYTHAENRTWGLSPHLSKLLSLPNIWTREPDQAIELESILMRLLNFQHGQLLTTGRTYSRSPAFDACLLERARAPVIVSMLCIRDR
ncbi:hypothetical protein DFS34DRAFT_150429 [Phlyctochytrium arcticum]|nr:hypothetical protein DFS34DRAFT_150429 [Phlyctochytrium arcticum]